MSGGSAPPPTQTSTQELSPEQRQLLQIAMPNIAQFGATAPERYSGPRVAGFTPEQEAGQAAAMGAAVPQAQVAQSAGDLSNWWMRPEALDVGSDPYVRSAIDASTRPITQNLLEAALPAIRSESAGAGPYGGSRQGIAEGLATGRAAQAVGDTASKVAMDAENARMQNQARVLALAPQTSQLYLNPATTMSGVGDVRQNLAQQYLNDAQQAFDFYQYQPYLRSKDIASLVSGIPGGSVVNTGSTPQQAPVAQRALGGALAGAAAGSMFGPWGTAIGAGAGGLTPFLFS